MVYLEFITFVGKFNAEKFIARPTNKKDLIVAANSQYEKRWKLIDSMPQEKQLASFSFEDRDRNLRDVLIRLYEWHQLLLHFCYFEPLRLGNEKIEATHKRLREKTPP